MHKLCLDLSSLDEKAIKIILDHQTVFDNTAEIYKNSTLELDVEEGYHELEVMELDGLKKDKPYPLFLRVPLIILGSIALIAIVIFSYLELGADGEKWDDDMQPYKGSTKFKLFITKDMMLSVKQRLLKCKTVQYGASIFWVKNADGTVEYQASELTLNEAVIDNQYKSARTGMVVAILIAEILLIAIMIAVLLAHQPLILLLLPFCVLGGVLLNYNLKKMHGNYLVVKRNLREIPKIYFVEDQEVKVQQMQDVFLHE